MELFITSTRRYCDRSCLLVNSFVNTRPLARSRSSQLISRTRSRHRSGVWTMDIASNQSYHSVIFPSVIVSTALTDDLAEVALYTGVFFLVISLNCLLR